MIRVLLALASGNGLFAVAFGAYGAHGLRPQLTEALWSSFSTASSYHFYHSLALLALVGIASRFPHRIWAWVAGCWQLGLLLFCGSIYGLVLGAPKWLGPITPIGGVLLMLGWALLLLTSIRNKDLTTR